MNQSLKLFALALTAAFLALTVRKQSPELALSLTLCACACGGVLLLRDLKPILALAASLASKAELDAALTRPLWRCLGLGLLTEISSSVCNDAGQTALAKLVELGGGLLCLVVSLPLLQAVLALIEELL